MNMRIIRSKGVSMSTGRSYSGKEPRGHPKEGACCRVLCVLSPSLCFLSQPILICWCRSSFVRGGPHGSRQGQECGGLALFEQRIELILNGVELIWHFLKAFWELVRWGREVTWRAPPPPVQLLLFWDPKTSWTSFLDWGFGRMRETVGDLKPGVQVSVQLVICIQTQESCLVREARNGTKVSYLI